MPQCTEEKSSDDRTARNDLRNGAGAFARYRPEPRGDRRMDIGRRNHPRHRGSRSPHARNGPATSIGRAKCATAACVARSSRRPDRGPRRPMEYCCRQQPRPKLPQRRSTSSCRNPIVSMNPGQQCRMKGGRSGKSKHPAWLSKAGRIFLICSAARVHSGNRCGFRKHIDDRLRHRIHDQNLVLHGYVLVVAQLRQFSEDLRRQ